MNYITLSVGPLKTNCYIVYDGKDAVIIDPGAEQWKIAGEIDALELNVKYIFLTHAHYDHFLAAEKLKEKYDSEIVIGTLDADSLSNPEYNMLCWFQTLKDKGIKADITVSDNEIIKVGNMQFQFVFTPGHTKGSLCIISENLIFSGDTLFHGDVGRCDLPGGNYDEIVKSIKSRLFTLPNDYKVLPGHLEETTLFYEKSYNACVR